MITTTLHYTYLATIFISAIFSLKVFRLNWPKAYKLFSCFVLVALATEIIATMWLNNYFGFKNFNPFKATNNHWIITIGLIPQYLLLILVYYHLLKSPRVKSIILFIIPLYILFSIANFIFWQGVDKVNDYTHMIANFVMLFLVFAYFEQIRKDNELLKLSKEPIVWISFGIFIYHLLNIPYIFCMNYLIKEKAYDTALNFHSFYLFVLIIIYLLYIKAFLCPTPQRK